MGNSEQVKPSGSEKPSSPAADQNNVHVYPDWAAMQAYYGPRLAVPPYMNSAVASHVPLPYMWAPSQSIIPAPYGTPYAAFYAHGGVYAHPGVPVTGTAMSADAPVKSSGNADGSFVKKLKEFDGLAISIGNGNSDCADRRQSDSDESNGSSDGSNGVASGAGRDGKKRNRLVSPNKGDGKSQRDSSLAPTMEVDHTSEKMPNAICANTALVLKDPSLSLKSSSSNGPQPSNERELKRERRKQSNRESARRSRLRKQAETEELAAKVQALSTENMTLTSEINKLVESSEKLKLENMALMEKLRAAQVGQIKEAELIKIDEHRLKPVGTVNLLERVNNNNDPSISRSNDDSDSHDNNRGSLRQLLDTNPRTDAVAAS